MDELIRKAQAGDLEAFSSLVRSEQMRLRAFIACRMAAAEVAEDLAQETFIVAYNRLQDFDPNSNFYAWLKGIAKNLILNERRKLSKQERIREEWIDAYVSHEEAPREGSVFDALKKCMARLTERMREFLRLRYDQELPLEEIGKNMGLSSGSTRVAHVRVLRSLRDCMQQSSPPSNRT